VPNRTPGATTHDGAKLAILQLPRLAAQMAMETTPIAVPTWAARQDDKPTLSEAIRRFVASALAKPGRKR
jgi:hypothetical protein